MESYVPRDSVEDGVNTARKRKQCTGEEKLAILRQLLLEGIAVDLPVVSADVGDVALRYRGAPNGHVVTRDAARLAACISTAFSQGRNSGGARTKKGPRPAMITSVRRSFAYMRAPWQELDDFLRWSTLTRMASKHRSTHCGAIRNEDRDDIPRNTQGETHCHA